MSKRVVRQSAENQTVTATPAILQDDVLDTATGGAKKISASVGKGGKNASTLDTRGFGGFRTTD